MNVRAALHLFVLIGCSVLACPSYAQRFQGPVATAMGGAGRAATDPVESFFLNPAAIRFLPPHLHVGIHGQNIEHPVSGDGNTWGVVLADGSLDKIVPGAFSYVRNTIRSPGAATARDQEFRASFGGLAYPGVGVGVGVHYREHEIENVANYYQTNVDMGALWRPTPVFGVGITAQNILSADDKAPESVRDVPTIGLGVLLNYEERFQTRLDLVRPDKFNPDRRIDVAAGLESLFNSGLALRIGCHWKESENKTLLGAGLGYRGPRLQLDYAYQQDTRISGASRHLIDLWIPF